MNKKYVVRLSGDERTMLERLVGVGKAAAFEHYLKTHSGRAFAAKHF